MNRTSRATYMNRMIIVSAIAVLLFSAYDRAVQTAEASAAGAKIGEATTLRPSCPVERHRVGEVVVYRAGDASKVGGLWPGKEVEGRSGSIDFTSAMHARQRANGSYVVFVEEDEFAKILYYLWKPPSVGAPGR